MHKNLLVVSVVVLLYLINKYTNDLISVQFKSFMTYGFLIAVLILGLYLVRTNTRGLDKNSDALQVVFFVVGLGLILYALYALVMV